MRDRRTKKGSAKGKRIKRRRIRGRRTEEASIGGTKTKEGSARSRKTGILVVVSILVFIGILVYLLASFRFGYLLLMLLLLLQSLILFPRIFFFILVILNNSNSFHDGTVILVQIGRLCMKFLVYVKLGIKDIAFSESSQPNMHAENKKHWGSNHQGFFVAFLI